MLSFEEILFLLSLLYLISMSIYVSLFLYKFALNNFKYKNKSLPYKSMFIFSLLGIVLTQVIREILIYKTDPNILYCHNDFDFNEINAFIISFVFISIFASIMSFSLFLIIFRKCKNFAIKHNKIVVITICVIIYIICVVIFMFISYMIPMVIREMGSYYSPHFESFLKDEN